MALDRFAIAAVADRLIYGSDTTFARADAIALLNLVPPARRDLFFGFELRGRSSSGSTSGFAAGVGQVSLPGDEGVR